MNRLQKRAWINLGVMIIVVVVGGTCVGLLVKLNAKAVGVVSLMAFLVAGLIVGLFSVLRSIAHESKSLATGRAGGMRKAPKRGLKVSSH